MGIWDLLKKKKKTPNLPRNLMEEPSPESHASVDLKGTENELVNILPVVQVGEISTAEERRLKRVVDNQKELAERRTSNLAAGGSRASEERQAAVREKNFLEWVEPISELKREGKLNQALDILYECIAVNEKSRYGPAPWYTWQAAIIHRKMKNYSAEVEVLERYMAANLAKKARSSMVDKIPDRLQKAKALLEKEQSKRD